LIAINVLKLPIKKLCQINHQTQTKTRDPKSGMETPLSWIQIIK